MEYLRKLGVFVDGVYIKNKVIDSDKQFYFDYDQILKDFEITSIEEIQAKVLIVTSLDLSASEITFRNGDDLIRDKENKLNLNPYFW